MGRNRLSKYGYYPSDIAPPGYLPRIIHELPRLPEEEEKQRRIWAEEVDRLLTRLQQERVRGIEPSAVDLALLAGYTGTYWIRRHRLAGVDDLYSAWKREPRPLPWGGVPVNVRMKPAVDSEWESRKFDRSSWLQFVQEREKRVEKKLMELKRPTRSGAADHVQRT